MESQIKSSFIPQDAGTEHRPKRAPRGSGGDLLILLSIILLMASLTLAGGVFLYSTYLSNSIVVKQNSIDRARAAIDPNLITELTKLDSRLDSAEELLTRHLSLSAVFSLLEQVTLQSVRLKEVSITRDGFDSLALTIDGEAESVNSIALQSDLFGRSGVITSPIFSDISRASNGLTTFHVDALLNPDALRYRNLFSSQPEIGAVEEQTTESETQTATTSTQTATSSDDTTQ